MAVDIDYYDLLSVPRNATGDAINEAVKKAMRQWRKKTEAADLEIRQSAEQRIKQIEEARATLTDPGRRQAYSSKLEREGVKSAEAVPAAPAGGTWLSKAKEYVGRGDFHSAAYAAREATQIAPNDADAWSTRSLANQGLNRLEDAWYEAQQAVELEPTNPDHHFNLGSVAENMGRYEQAISFYRRAANIDPSQPMYELAIGSVYLDVEEPERARQVIEPIQRRYPDHEAANAYLAMALLAITETVPARRDRDSYWVTSESEIATMRRHLARVSGLKNLPPDIRSEARRIGSYLDSLSRKKFNIPIAMLAASDMGCLGVVLAIAIVGLPIVIMLVSFGLMGNGSVAAGIFWLLVAGGIGFLWYRLLWVPQWKINKRIHG